MKGTNMLRLIIFDLILNLPDLTKSNNRLQVMQYVFYKSVLFFSYTRFICLQSYKKTVGFIKQKISAYHRLPLFCAKKRVRYAKRFHQFLFLLKFRLYFIRKKQLLYLYIPLFPLFCSIFTGKIN